jgi:hypothetical protein
MRQIAANLRDAEKCLALTQQKGGGRHAPVYLPTVEQLRALANPLSSTPSKLNPSLPPVDHHNPAIDSDSSASGHQGQLDASSTANMLEQTAHEDTALALAAPKSIKVRIGGQRDSDGRARPALAPADPAATAVAQSLARGGLVDASMRPERVRKKVKNIPDLYDGCDSLSIVHAYACCAAPVCERVNPSIFYFIRPDTISGCALRAYHGIF